MYILYIMENNGVKEVENIDEVLQREVLAAGTGGRLNMPKKHLGKKVKIIIFSNQENKEEAIAN